MAEPATDFTLDTAAVLAEEEHGGPIVGRSPWYLAWRRLRRNYIAFFALMVFVVIAVACALAPVYAHDIAHTGPNDTHVSETVTVGGHVKPVISAPVYVTDAQGNVRVKTAGVVLGPTWWHAHGRFVLGADTLGRDVAVRLLYGGLNSLTIGIGSALICTLVAIFFALIAGYYGGWVDWIITRSFDLIWAFPVLLLAIALGSALSVNGFHHFGISISPNSLWIPTLVIAYVYIPYIGIDASPLAIATVLVAAGIWFAGNLVRSTFGRALIAISAGELGAQALAVDAERLKRQTFVLSAVFAGVAGSVYASQQSYIDPGSFSFLLSVNFVLMSVIGGLRSLWGAVIGAAIVVVLGQLLQAYVPVFLPSARGDFQQFFLGVILIAMLILLPRGITSRFSEARA